MLKFTENNYLKTRKISRLVSSKFAVYMFSKYGGQLSNLSNHVRGFQSGFLHMRCWFVFCAYLAHVSLYLKCFLFEIWLVFFVSMVNLRIRLTRIRRMCSCPHLKDFKKADGLKVFRKVHAHFVCCGSREARKRKVQHGCKFPRWRPADKQVRHCDFIFMSFISLDSRQNCVIATNVEHTQAVSILAFCASILVATPETGTSTITRNQLVIL